MGQRHQYIVVFPKIQYASKDNPNNRPVQVGIIHHQWLYGHSAIRSLDRVLRLIKACSEDVDFMFGTDNSQASYGDAMAAIAAAMSVAPDEGYYHRVHQFDKPYSPRGTHGTMLDNNDGVTVIQLEQGNPKPRVCFATPGHVEGNHWSEEEHGYGAWTPEQYLSFYYSEAEQKEWAEKDHVGYLHRVIRPLADISRNSRPMATSQLRKLLPNLTPKKDKVTK